MFSSAVASALRAAAATRIAGVAARFASVDTLGRDVFSRASLYPNGEMLNHHDTEKYAEELKNWAKQRGVTTFKHFFHPLGGNGRVAGVNKEMLTYDTVRDSLHESFTADALMHGETDASSYPSGGLRETHHAGGYTLWDAGSRPFIMNDVVHIPAVFYTWDGHALDQKIPLARANEALHREMKKLVKHLTGEDIKQRIDTYCGAEQEFFLVDRALAQKRDDLLATGRCMFGRRPIFGQQSSDHYMATVPPHIQRFMHEVRDRAWLLGIPVDTTHNEVAPGQFEVSSLFTTCNQQQDNNAVLMSLLRQVAHENDLEVLLHEKPFRSVNGSGKHTNWSINVGPSVNFFKPGKTDETQLRFLATLAAFVAGVDQHADLLRASIACPGNDHRLGACEAPPAIISVYTGHQLMAHIEKVMAGGALTGYRGGTLSRSLGAHQYGNVVVPAEDRNRTSPLPFNSHRFEFRAVGSSQPVAWPCTMLAVVAAAGARILNGRIDAILEKGVARHTAVEQAVRETLLEHKRIIFNGDCYSQEWRMESARRGIANVPTAADAYTALSRPENVALLSEMGVFSPEECSARYNAEVGLYTEQLKKEADVLRRMAQIHVLPAAQRTAALGLDIDAGVVSSWGTEVSRRLEQIDSLSGVDAARFAITELRDSVAELQMACEQVESVAPSDVWHLPTFEELLNCTRY